MSKTCEDCPQTIEPACKLCKPCRLKRKNDKRRGKPRADRAVWDAANKEKYAAYRRKWKAANVEKVIEDRIIRQRIHRRAVPAWTDSEFERFAIAETYALARLRSVVTGVDWHVDHVVPLNSKLVCGFHCLANLRVIPAATNRRKSNKLMEDLLNGNS